MNIINRTHGGSASGSIFRIAVGILALVLLLSTGALGTPITLTPPGGAPGTQVTASGSGSTPGANVIIVALWDDPISGTYLNQTHVDSNGNFVLTFLVPSNAGTGSHNIFFTQQFIGAGLGTFWKIPFTVTAPTTYTISVSTSPSGLNPQPSGGGTYNAGKTATVTAQSVTGYTFQKWTENGAQVSTSMSYSFTVTGNRNLVAVFMQNTNPNKKDIATFIKDETIPDRSILDANLWFRKIWQFKNSGETEWIGYTLDFASGDKLGDTSSVPIPNTKPGETVNIEIVLKAPASPTPAVKEGSWKIKNQAGSDVEGGLATVSIIVNPTPGTNIPNLGKPSYNKQSYTYGGNNYNDGVNPYANDGFGGQCTAFAWGRALEKLGITGLPQNDAKKWWYDYSLPKGNTVRANSIAVWGTSRDDPNPGHVAYVEAVNGDNITINEANFIEPNLYAFRDTNWGGGYNGAPYSLNSAQMNNRGPGALLGYIYLDSSLVERVWTMDGNNKDKTSFVPGDAIHYGAIVNNGGSSTVKATFTFLASGPSQIYSWTGQGDVAPGSPSFYSPSTIPVAAPAGTYTLTVNVTYNGLNSSKQSQFTVQAPPTLNPVQIKSATLKSGVLTIVGTGFETKPSNNAQNYVTFNHAGTSFNANSVTSWVDTKIVAKSNKAVVGDTVTVKTRTGKVSAPAKIQ